MEGFLPKGGGYKRLKVYAISEAIYDLTVYFVNHFIERGSRTRDQMEQAARSGCANIAEGSAASMTSKETEIKLTNVAKASLEEVLLDYKAYLRQHNLPLWDKDNPRTEKLRMFLKSEDFSENPMKYAEKMNAEEYCNLCITLLNQATYMLARLIKKQEQQFLESGGIREQMFKARLDYREKNKKGFDQTGQTSQTGPTSPTSPTSLKGPKGPTKSKII